MHEECGNSGRQRARRVERIVIAAEPGQFDAGTTERLGGDAQTRPVDVKEIFATVYNNLGIDPRTTTISDPSGRPQYLTQMDPIAEVS